VSRTSWSWDKRRRLALAINLVVLCGVICVAVVSSDSSDWQPLELVFVLGAFAIASDLLSVRIKGIAAADGREHGWQFTASAPYVLAVVLLRLEVADNGHGFERLGLGTALEQGHIGLASASERIEALGGAFEIDSQLGTGTVARATIPVLRDAAVEPETWMPAVAS
jgi:hypothetical protein